MNDRRQLCGERVTFRTALLADFVADAPENHRTDDCDRGGSARANPSRASRRTADDSRSSSCRAARQSKASSITTKPMRSHRSSSSGAGGLWLVRIALTPISFRISSWRSSARSVDRRAQRPKIVMIADAVERHVLAVEKKAFVGVELDRADAERRFVAYRRLFLDRMDGLLDRGNGGIKIRLLQSPELRVVDPRWLAVPTVARARRRSPIVCRSRGRNRLRRSSARSTSS